MCELSEIAKGKIEKKKRKENKIKFKNTSGINLFAPFAFAFSKMRNWRTSQCVFPQNLFKHLCYIRFLLILMYTYIYNNIYLSLSLARNSKRY